MPHGRKGQTNATDAQLAVEAFQGRLAAPAASAVAELQSVSAARPTRRHPMLRKRPQSKAVEKAALMLSGPRRIRDREHVRFVAGQPCLICGRSPSDPHHLRFTQSRALGSKVSDEFTVPLCRGHHRELHRCGDEAAWWQRAGIDPTVTARKLWLETHPLPAARAETAKGQKTKSTEISRSHGVA